MSPQENRLATIKEVAEYLQVPVGTIYGWRYRGEGPPGYRVGKHVRYRWADVDQWLENQRDQPRSERKPPPPRWLPVIPSDYRPLRRIRERRDDGTEILACGHSVRGRPEDYAQRRRCDECA